MQTFKTVLALLLATVGALGAGQVEVKDSTTGARQWVTLSGGASVAPTGGAVTLGGSPTFTVVTAPAFYFKADGTTQFGYDDNDGAGLLTNGVNLWTFGSAGETVMPGILTIAGAINGTTMPTSKTLVVTSDFGTGVATALGVNIGTAGGVQLNNGSGAALTALTAANITASTTAGRAILNVANPSAISFIKIAADNTVSTRTPAQVLSDIGGIDGTALNATNLTSGTVPDTRNTVSNSTTTTMSALATIGGLTTVTGTGAMSMTGGAGNWTQTAGTGNSRTMTLRTTDAAGTAASVLILAASATSAANQVTITNSVAAGMGPIIASTGSDTNIGLTVKNQGSGQVLIRNGTTSWLQVDSSAIYLQAGSGNYLLALNGTGVAQALVTSFEPWTDNSPSLGTGSKRWNSLTIGTGATALGGTLAVIGTSALTGGASVGAPAANAGGTLKVDTTTTGNVGAGEDTLITYTVPAATLATNGDSLEYDVWGSCAANTNTKDIKVYFGATAMIDGGVVILNGVSWRAHGKIVRTGAATQTATAELTVGGTLLSGSNSTIALTTAPAETLSGTVVFKVTGTSAIAPADNDIVQNGMVLRWFPNK